MVLLIMHLITLVNTLGLTVILVYTQVKVFSQWCMCYPLYSDLVDVYQ